MPIIRSYLVWGSVAGSFPRSSKPGGNLAHSLLLNSSRSGRGRSHLLREAQSRRRRAGSRAAPARAGAAAAGGRCARAGGRRGGREAGRAGAPAARSPSLPRTLARRRPPASRSLALAHTRARPRGRRPPASGAPGDRLGAEPAAGALLEHGAGGHPFQPRSLGPRGFSISSLLSAPQCVLAAR